MARKPNYRFERFERERVKAAKKAARAQAKAEKAEQAKAEKAGLTDEASPDGATSEVGDEAPSAD